jgi:hypothetical protein
MNQEEYEQDQSVYCEDTTLVKAELVQQNRSDDGEPNKKCDSFDEYMDKEQLKDSKSEQKK